MKLSFHLLLSMLSILCTERVFATGQIPDKLIYNKDTLLIFANPLEQYPHIDSLRTILFDRQQINWNTACGRGYQAEWTIIDSVLFLTAIYSCHYQNDKLKADLNKLFGEKCKDGKVKADWVTGNMLSPQGKLLYYVHSYYASLYERELVFEIVNGQLKATTTYDNSRSKKSIYSDEAVLMKFIYANIKWETLPEQYQKVIVFLQFSANEQGVIDSVKIVRRYNEEFDAEAVRVLQAIPQWDVYYRRGQHERRSYNLPIIFSEENREKYKKER